MFRIQAKLSDNNYRNILDIGNCSELSIPSSETFIFLLQLHIDVSLN